MPQVVAAIGWALAGAAATSATAIAVGYFLIGAATVIGYGLLLAGAAAMQSRAKRKARDRYNASQVDRLQNIVTTTTPRELVLGRVRKGGAVVFRDSCGTHNEKFAMVIVLASHRIDGVEKFYLNEQEVTVNSSGAVTTAPYNIRRTVDTPTSEVVPGSCYYYFIGDESGAVVERCQYYTYDSKVNIRIYDGSQTTADSRLMSLFPGVWTSNHKLLGVAYAIVELDYDESVFPSGIPSLTVVMRGAQVFDPRSGQTAFSENPALHARHVITHPRFGKRSSLTAREDARIAAAANACDTAYTPAGGSTTSLYKSSIVLPYGGQAADALDDLCQGMCGMWAYAGGEFFIKAGVYTAPVKTLTAADLLTTQTDSQGGSTSKGITINTHRARADKINSVTAKIYDANAEYKETTITPVKAQDAIANDGKELPLEMTLPSVSSASQAQVVCNYMLKDSFDPLAITANFKLSAYELELFDNVALDIPRYGWSSKVFTVLSKNFSPTGSIEMTLRETSAALFNPLVFADSDGFADNTNLVEPWDIDHPGVLTISSGTADLLLQGDGSLVTRVRVQWIPILDERIRQGGYVEIRWKDVRSETWSTVSVPGVESSTYLLGAVDGITVVVMARTRTQLAVSDWNVQKTHLVLGKSEPPSDVASFLIEGTTLSWTPVQDADLAGYEIRRILGAAKNDWGGGSPIHTGILTSSPYSVSSILPVAHSYMIKAIDSSGNYSTNPAYVAVAAGDTLVENVLESYDYGLIGYPGAVVGGTVSGTNLFATQTSSFYGSNSLLFYKLDTSNFYSENYDEVSWISSPFTPSIAAANSKITLDILTNSLMYTVYFRRTGPTIFFDSDLNFFYTSDTAEFYDKAPDFEPWPGSISAVSDEYQFKFVALAGTTATVLSKFVVNIDVPDKVVYLSDLLVPSTGLRLPVANQFFAIKNIQLTLQNTTAISVNVDDKNVELGPLIFTRNSAGTAVSSTVDAIIQGY